MKPTPALLPTKNLSGSKFGVMSWLLWLLLFILPSWPSYIQRKIGPLPAINGQRIILFTLIAICVIRVLFDKSVFYRLNNRIVDNSNIFYILVLYCLVRMASCFVSPIFFYSFSQVVWEIVDVFGCMFVVIVAAESRSDIKALPRIILFSSIVVCALAIFEGVTQSNPLIGLSDVTAVDSLNIGVIDKIREGVRRAQGTFASPLLLGEFCSIAIPFVWIVAISDSRYFMRIIAWLSIPLLVAAIYFSHSRIGSVSAVAIIGIWSVWSWVRFIKNKKVTIYRYIVAFYGFVIMVFVACFSIYFVFRLAQGWDFEAIVGLKKGAPSVLLAYSSNARLDQFMMAIPKFISSPLLGYGVGLGGYELGYIGTNGRLTVDSYLLLLILDSGLFAVLLWIYIYFLIFRKAMFGFINCNTEDRRLYAAFAYMVISVVLSSLIHSLSDLFSLAFAMVGCLLVLADRCEIGASKAQIKSFSKYSARKL